MKTTTFGKYIVLSILGLGLALSSCKKDEEPVIVDGPVDTFITGASHAEIQVPIIAKATGENCPPCGGWGWTAWGTLSTDMAGKAFCWANYAGGYAPASGFRGNELNKPNSDATSLLSNFTGITGYPNFVVNCVSAGTSESSAKSAANTSIASSSVKASVAFTYELKESTLTIKAEAKLYENLSGDYYLGAYVVEDKIVAYQAGNSAGNNAEHHLVFRGSMSSSTWGEQIITASANSGDVLSKTFTVTIPSDYNKNNLTYGVILWKKNGGKYVYINAGTNQVSH